LMLGRVVGEVFGSNGTLIGAVGLGLADVDAVTISVSRLVPQPLNAEGAGVAILAAVASNMLAKLAVSAAIGRGRFAIAVAIMTTGCWLAAGLALSAPLALGAR
jgi:uncharacterized membrane protein (DUF4010 family)